MSVYVYIVKSADYNQPIMYYDIINCRENFFSDEKKTAYILELHAPNRRNIPKYHIIKTQTLTSP